VQIDESLMAILEVVTIGLGIINKIKIEINIIILLDHFGRLPAHSSVIYMMVAFNIYLILYQFNFIGFIPPTLEELMQKDL
jgi:hypothetical protein